MRASVALIAGLAGCDLVFELESSEIEPPDPLFPAFSAPVPVPGPINTEMGEEDDPTLSTNMLELFYSGAGQLHRATRLRVEDPWSSAEPVLELDAAGMADFRPSLSSDGLTLYFSRGAMGMHQVHVATRDMPSGSWREATMLALDLNQPGVSITSGWSSPDGLVLIVGAPSATGTSDIYIATRATIDEPFTSRRFDELCSDANDGGGWATEDGKRIVFESDRTGTMAIWEAVEQDGVWQIHHHAELDTDDIDGTPWLSPDGKVIVFSRTVTINGARNDDLYMAIR